MTSHEPRRPAKDPTRFADSLVKVEVTEDERAHLIVAIRRELRALREAGAADATDLPGLPEPSASKSASPAAAETTVQAGHRSSRDRSRELGELIWRLESSLDPRVPVMHSADALRPEGA